MCGDTVASSIGESEPVTMENLATLHEVGGVVQEGAFGLNSAEENSDNSQYNVNDILDFFELELFGPDNAEDPSAARQECTSIEEENPYNSHYNGIFYSFERELLGPDNVEDPSATRQECPSIEGSLARADETVLKKKPKRAVKKHNPYRGVKKRRDRWAAQVRDPSKGKYVWIGTFDSPLEAARAYDAAASRLRGKKAKLNFSDESPPKKSKKTCKFTQYLERYKTCKSYKTCKCAQYLKSLTLSKKSGRHVNAHNGSEGIETTVVADCGSLRASRILLWEFSLKFLNQRTHLL